MWAGGGRKPCLSPSTAAARPGSAAPAGHPGATEPRAWPAPPQLAGLALHDADRRRLAEQALTGCLSDHRQLGHLTDASLCHGCAGLLHTAWRIAGDATDTGSFPIPGMLKEMERQVDRHQPHHDDNLLEGATRRPAGPAHHHHRTTGLPLGRMSAAGRRTSPTPATPRNAPPSDSAPVWSNHERTP